MTETINMTKMIHKDRKEDDEDAHLISWAMIEVMTAACKGGDILNLWPKVKNRQSDAKGKDLTLDVCMTIEGVEVPFSDTLKRLHRHCMEQIERRAGEIVMERASEPIRKLEDLLATAKKDIREKLKKLFPGIELEEW